MFENRVLRRIFWPDRDKEVGEWGKLHNEEFLILSFRRVLYVICFLLGNSLAYDF